MAFVAMKDKSVKACIYFFISKVLYIIFTKMKI